MTRDYRSRILAPDDALAAVRSGHRVYIHNGCAEPVELVKALTRRGPDLADVEVLHMATMGIADYTLPEYEGHFRHNALFIGGNVRTAVQEGRADYTPIFLSEIESLFTCGALPIDVCLLQCTPPDPYGYMSLGPSIDASLTAAQCAKHVIVEINDQMPRTLGDTFFHVSRADAFIETSHPLSRISAPSGLGPARRDRPTHRSPDPRRRDDPDGDRRDPGGRARSAARPQGPRAALGNGARVGRRADAVGRHQRRAQDDSPAEGDRGLRARRQTAVRFHRQQSELRVPPHGLCERSRSSSRRTSAWWRSTRRSKWISPGRSAPTRWATLLIAGSADRWIFCAAQRDRKAGCRSLRCPQRPRTARFRALCRGCGPGAGVVTSRGDVHYVITEHGVAYLHGKTLRQRAEAPDPRGRSTVPGRTRTLRSGEQAPGRRSIHRGGVN